MEFKESLHAAINLNWRLILFFLQMEMIFHMNSSSRKTCFKWRLTRSHGQIHVGVYIRTFFVRACGFSVFVAAADSTKISVSSVFSFTLRFKWPEID